MVISNSIIVLAALKIYKKKIDTIMRTRNKLTQIHQANKIPVINIKSRRKKTSAYSFWSSSISSFFWHPVVGLAMLN